jgi:hypothetical protein
MPQLVRDCLHVSSEHCDLDETTYMTSRDVERIVRSVLRQYGLRMALRDIQPRTDGWDVVLMPKTGTAIHITLPEGPAHMIRNALLSQLNVDG